MASDPMLGLGPLVAGARRACAKAETLPDGANTPRVEMMTDSLRQLCDAIEYLIKRTTRRPDDELDRIVAWLNEGRPAHSGTMSAKAADAIDSLRAELAATRRMVDELSMRGTRANFDLDGTAMPILDALCLAMRRERVAVDPAALLERIAQLTAHRGCCGTEHDPANGKIHGLCVVCGVPWPCEYAGLPPALAATAPDTAKGER